MSPLHTHVSNKRRLSLFLSPVSLSLSVSGVTDNVPSSTDPFHPPLLTPTLPYPSPVRRAPRGFSDESEKGDTRQSARERPISHTSCLRLTEVIGLVFLHRKCR